MIRIRQKTLAWIAVAALLFSALSPAVASALFAGRPDILALVLGVPVPQTTAQGVICHQEVTAAASDSGTSVPHPQSDDTSGHTAHGIFCSFCVAASATVTLHCVPLKAIVVSAAADKLLPAGRVQPPPARLPSTHRSRAPPIVS